MAKEVSEVTVSTVKPDAEVGDDDDDDAQAPHEADEEEENDEGAAEEAREKIRREREARAQALTLEIVGDLPFAEVKPPENVLFVCKLNPVTEGQLILRYLHQHF